MNSCLKEAWRITSSRVLLASLLDRIQLHSIHFWYHHHHHQMLMCINTEGVQPMAWCSRMQIAMDIARGISFLHSLNANIIYRDLKASNILIDSVCCNLLLHASLTPLLSQEKINWLWFVHLFQRFHAKLSDFGLARRGPIGDGTHVSTRVVGTMGYAAPEYVASGVLLLLMSQLNFRFSERRI